MIDDKPRPPLGNFRTEEAMSNYATAMNRWHADQAAKAARDAVLADLAARRVLLPADLERAAERLRRAS